MLHSLSPVLRLISLAWWKWARRELTQRDPMHPDLPGIVMKINQLESM